MSTRSDAVKKWRANTKHKLVECCGGKCNRCGYDRCSDALEFHHKEENEKSFTIGSIMASPIKWELIVEEVKKCILLCSICHRELHCGLWKLDDIESIKPSGFERYKKEVLPTGKCPICGKDVCGTITCSRSCAAVKRIKCAWPTKEELVELKKQYSRTKIADMLGVSESAVRKREKKLGIYSLVVQ